MTDEVKELLQMKKIEFQLTTVQGSLTGCNEEALSVFMRCNGKTANAINSIDSFATKESAKMMLTAVITEMLERVYPND